MQSNNDSIPSNEQPLDQSSIKSNKWVLRTPWNNDSNNSDDETTVVSLLSNILIYSKDDEYSKSLDPLLSLVQSNPSLLSLKFQESTILHLLCTSRHLVLEHHLLESIIQVASSSSLSSIMTSVDENNQTPLHCLCGNPNAQLGGIRIMMTTQSLTTTSLVNNMNQTPLHLVLVHNPRVCLDMLTLLGNDPAVRLSKDTDGNTPLSLYCKHPNVSLQGLLFLAQDSILENEINPIRLLLQNPNATLKMIQALLDLFPELYSKVQRNEDGGMTLLHLLCSKTAVSITNLLIQTAVEKFPSAISMKDNYGQLPIHLLCQNPALSVETLSLLKTEFGCDNYAEALPLHYLCMNESITLECLKEVLIAKDSYRKDVYGATPIHYLCRNTSVNTILLKTLLSNDAPSDIARDNAGRTPLHYLCMNSDGITLKVLNTLLEAYPLAPTIQDSDLKFANYFLNVLPNDLQSDLQYRMTIRNKVILNRYEVLLQEKNKMITVAKDLKTSEKVYLKQFSDKEEFEALISLMSALEDNTVAYLPERVLATFDNVNESSDSLLVTYYCEKYPCNFSIANGLEDIVSCLSYWHSKNVVHGNITLQNIARFKAFRLINFNHASLFDQPLNNTLVATVPPENSAVAQPESDMWQLGNLIVEMVTGKSVLSHMVPWLSTRSNIETRRKITSCFTDDAIYATLYTILVPLLTHSFVITPTLILNLLKVNSLSRWNITQVSDYIITRKLIPKETLPKEVQIPTNNNNYLEKQCQELQQENERLLKELCKALSEKKEAESRLKKVLQNPLEKENFNVDTYNGQT